MTTYRKKPDEVTAIYWRGNNLAELKEFCPTCKLLDDMIMLNPADPACLVKIGDILIKNVLGEISKCDEKKFIMTYESVL